MGLELKKYREWAKTHKNIITPSIKSVKYYKGFIIEVSEGTDFSHNQIYGVSLMQKTESGYTSSLSGLSKMVRDKKEIRSVQNEMKAWVDHCSHPDE